jgi:hypothetical protein
MFRAIMVCHETQGGGNFKTGRMHLMTLARKRRLAELPALPYLSVRLGSPGQHFLSGVTEVR